jgi:hypothetical protein
MTVTFGHHNHYSVTLGVADTIKLRILRILQTHTHTHTHTHAHTHTNTHTRTHTYTHTHTLDVYCLWCYTDALDTHTHTHTHTSHPNIQAHLNAMEAHPKVTDYYDKKVAREVRACFFFS